MPAHRHSIISKSSHEADLEPDICRIKVVVRLRPFNSRELQKHEAKVVQFIGHNQIELFSPVGASSRQRSSVRAGTGPSGDSRTFTFDQTFWSFDKPLVDNLSFASQESVFASAVTPLLDHAFKGFNTCMFAYGQTGSGKSYTMLGFNHEPGVIPRVGQAIFDRIQSTTSSLLKYTVVVSYYEIYNEKVRDLLNLKNKDNLKVREHPLRGPYVEDLSALGISTFPEMQALLLEGNKTRTVAVTNMNQSSSRSHAVFTITLTQTVYEENGSPTTEKVSRIHLVDLAGSERARMAGTSGMRLKEGAEINRSLTTLGRVISTLVEKASHPNRRIVVPYRESTLTWLLKDALGGNSMTAMIATIAPSASNHDQTLSTLRFASNVKQITNHAVINEDPNAKLIRELKDELENLRAQLQDTNQFNTTIEPSIPERQDLMEKLMVSEKLLQDVNQTWEQKLKETEQIQKQTATALEDLGISIEDGFVGLHTPRKVPFLVNLSDDPLLTECLVYNIRYGSTLVGHMSNPSAEIRLSSPGILFEHCNFVNLGGSVTITPYENASVIVNGEPITEPQELHTGFRIILGNLHIFRYSNPLEKKPPTQKGHRKSSSLAVSTTGPNGFEFPRRVSTPPPKASPTNSSSSPSEADWSFALNEAASKHVGHDEASLDALDDDDLQQLYSQVLKAKNSRASRPSSACGYRVDLPPTPVPFYIDRTSPPPRRSRLSIGDGSLLLNDSPDLSPRYGRHRASSNASMMSGNGSPRRRSLIIPSSVDLSRPPSPKLYLPTALFSEHERLVKKYSNLWRKHTLVKEISTLLSYLQLIRKAQRYSDNFDLNLKFQLMVADDVHLSPYETFQSPLFHITGPISVRIMDFVQDVVHITSLPHLEAKLPQTDQFEVLRKPQLPLSFTCSKYTLVGIAKGLESGVGVSTAEIMSPYTHSAVGVAKLTVREVTTAPLSALKLNAIAVTTKIATVSISGLSTEEVIDVHVSLYTEDEQTPILVSPILQFDADSPLTFPSYFHVDEEKHKSFRLLVYASIRRPFLDRLLSWDEMQEPGLDLTFPKQDCQTARLQSLQTPEFHDSDGSNFVESINSAKSIELESGRSHVGMYVQILELNENGAYSSVDVVEDGGSPLPAYSFLHQGLQRRLEITLLTGDNVLDCYLQDTPEIRVKVGGFRMVDSQCMIVDDLGTSSEGADDKYVTLKRVSTVTQVSISGFNGVKVTCQWPSTTPLLDRITPDTNRLLYTICVDLGTGTDRTSFKCPGSAAIRSRLSSGVSRWEILFGQVGITNSYIHWFITRNEYHRVPKTRRDFEALLGGRKSSDENGRISQRGVSLLSEYYQIKEQHQVAEKVQQARRDNQPLALPIAETDSEAMATVEQQALLQECIDLWKTKTPSNLDTINLWDYRNIRYSENPLSVDQGVGRSDDAEARSANSEDREAKEATSGDSQSVHNTSLVINVSDLEVTSLPTCSCIVVSKEFGRRMLQVRYPMLVLKVIEAHENISSSAIQAIAPFGELLSTVVHSTGVTSSSSPSSSSQAVLLKSYPQSPVTDKVGSASFGKAPVNPFDVFFYIPEWAFIENNENGFGVDLINYREQTQAKPQYRYNLLFNSAKQRQDFNLQLMFSINVNGYPKPTE